MCIVKTKCVQITVYIAWQNRFVGFIIVYIVLEAIEISFHYMHLFVGHFRSDQNKSARLRWNNCVFGIWLNWYLDKLGFEFQIQSTTSSTNKWKIKQYLSQLGNCDRFSVEVEKINRECEENAEIFGKMKPKWKTVILAK